MITWLKQKIRKYIISTGIHDITKDGSPTNLTMRGFIIKTLAEHNSSGPSVHYMIKENAQLAIDTFCARTREGGELQQSVKEKLLG